MKARTYKKLLRLNQDEWERLRYLSKSTGLNQEQVLRPVSSFYLRILPYFHLKNKTSARSANTFRMIFNPL